MQQRPCRVFHYQDVQPVGYYITYVKHADFSQCPAQIACDGIWDVKSSSEVCNFLRRRLMRQSRGGRNGTDTIGYGPPNDLPDSDFDYAFQSQRLGRGVDTQKILTWLMAQSNLNSLRMSLAMAMEQLLEACCTSDPKRSMGLGADNMTLVVVVCLGLALFFFANDGFCKRVCAIPGCDWFLIRMVFRPFQVQSMGP